MIVALYALAAAMMIGGIASVIQGFPFVRLESGLAMTIAGATVASAGAVLFGLGAVVSRLKRVEGALAFRRLADEARPAPVPGAEADAVFPPPVAEPALPASPSPAAPVAAAVGLAGAGLAASRVGREPVFDGSTFGTPTAEDPALPGHDAPHLAEPAPHLAEPHAPPAAEAEPALPLDARPASEFVPEPLPDHPHSSEPEPTPDEPGTVPDPEPLHASAPEDDLFAGPTPEVAASHLHDSHLHEHGEPLPPADEAPALRAALATDEPEAAPEPSREVVGTYASGGNTYVMFSDGAIQADTPRGRFTFGSLDELKAFVDGGGEADRGAA